MLQPSPHPRRTIPRRSSGTQTHDAYPFPAPMRGLNTALPLPTPAGSPLTALLLENLIPRAFGLELRAGYLHWVGNLGGEVRSLMPYKSATGLAKLLAATSNGDIFDVTAQQPAVFGPSPLVNVTNGVPPGEWTSLNFVTSAGVHYLVMVNPGGGYWLYDGATFTHVIAGAGAFEIAGVDPDSFVFVTVYKNRLWFIEGDSTRAWYLPVGVVAGAATAFDFGAMLPSGGSLAALINWTFDGSSGVGINGQMVIVGSQGDVLVYTGDDPDVANEFRSTGRWFVGRVPVGHRFFSLYLADVLILSERGLCFMSELMRGEGFFQNAATAVAINNSLAPEIARSLDVRYWEVRFLPQEQLIVVNRAEINVQNLQWVYEVNNKAFAMLRGMPMNTVETFEGRTFFGDLVGTVWLSFEGASDGAIDGVPGVDLEGLLATAFQPLGEGVRVKRFLMVRPSFISSVAPFFKAVLNSEWRRTVPPGAEGFLGSDAALWDSGLWDVALWSGEGQSFEAWVGATGSGRYGSLGLRVRGNPGTLFVGWQALVEAGGIL